MATITFIVSLIFLFRIETIRHVGETVRQIRFFNHIYLVSSGFYYFLIIGTVVLGLLVLRELYTVKTYLQKLNT